MADVVKAAVFLHNSLHLEVNLETLIYKKLSQEDSRYPINAYKGKSKYQKSTVEQREHQPQQKLPTKNVNKAFTIEFLQEKAWSNSVKREWDKFYTPASLCLGIFEDCSKIYTSFQRRTTVISNSYEKVVWATAGILILVLRLHKYLELDDLGKSVVTKLNKDLQRFG